MLAAGDANRMFPLNQIMEKSLLPVNGKPVIRHIVENLTQPEVAKHLRKITICCNIKFKKQFEHEFRDMPNIKFDLTRTANGTHTAWKYMIWHQGYLGYKTRNITEWSMVHYADCLTDINNADFILKINNEFDGLIAVTNTVKHDYSEVICISPDRDLPIRNVNSFYEKPKISNYTWSGIGLFKTEKVEKLGEDRSGIDFAIDIFPQMIEQRKLKAYPYNGFWYDVGNLNSYRKVFEMFKE